MQQPTSIPSNTPATVAFSALSYALDILRVTPQRPDQSFPMIAELERGYTAAIQSVANPPPPAVNFEERHLESQATNLILLSMVKMQPYDPSKTVREFVDEVGITAGVEPAAKARYDKVIEKLQVMIDEPEATSSDAPAVS